MNETIGRRFSQKNIKAWGLPDLIVIDGGKGQLDAALKARDDRGQILPMIGLAKREEQIVIDYARSGLTLDRQKLQDLDGRLTTSDNFALVNIPQNSHIIKLLQRIRDESHRFAVSYHTVLKRQKQTMSILEEIPGIGPTTRKKLIKHFGSVRQLQSADLESLVNVVGQQKATLIERYLSRP